MKKWIIHNFSGQWETFPPFLIIEVPFSPAVAEIIYSDYPKEANQNKVNGHMAVTNSCPYLLKKFFSHRFINWLGSYDCHREQRSHLNNDFSALIIVTIHEDTIIISALASKVIFFKLEHISQWTRLLNRKETWIYRECIQNI